MRGRGLIANTVIQASNGQLTEMKQAYTPYIQPKLPPGALFSAKKGSITITAYKSGKVMFQGAGSELEASKWGNSLQKSTPSMAKHTLPDGFQTKNVLGSDEVGTGDFFGPITVCAAYVAKEQMPLLTSLGVKDSKAMKDPEICQIAEKIMPIIPHSVLLCPNTKYNELIGAGINQGQMKAMLHNRALQNVLRRMWPEEPDAILIDQFAEKNTYYRYLAKESDVVRDKVFFATKAEGLHLSVAAASIIARYKFVEAFSEMETELKMPLTKGAGPKVDQVAAQIIKKYGTATLEKYTKKHFANTEKANRLARL